MRIADCRPHACATLVAAAALLTLSAANPIAAQDMPNSCPVDGCEVKIVSVAKDGDELRLIFEANYTPDMSRNHIHVWWGENYKIDQVTTDAETAHHTTQGEWHPTDDYPEYVTQSAASTKVRGEAKTLCVSAADGNHVILDVTIYQCTDVSAFL